MMSVLLSSVSVCRCIAQFNSVQTATCSLCLVKIGRGRNCKKDAGGTVGKEVDEGDEEAKVIVMSVLCVSVLCSPRHQGAWSAPWRPTK